MRMPALLSVSLVVMLLALVGAPGDASAWHGRVFVGIGPGWWGPYPYWWYPPPYYAYPPQVVVEEPPVYVQQPMPPPAPPPAPEWYFCPSSRGYYPAVQTCPEPWVRVPARPQ